LSLPILYPNSSFFLILIAYTFFFLTSRLACKYFSYFLYKGGVDVYNCLRPQKYQDCL
jgi:hypothetical protein